jgi:MraZ protein
MDQSGADGVFRGNFSVRIDEKGRLKIPTAFRTILQRQYGDEVFVTSVTGDEVTIYPMHVWVARETRLSQLPSATPSLRRYLDRVNFYGQSGELDKQGRISIHPRLRESAAMSGLVDVFGQYNFLDVWNHERFLEKLKREPYTDEDAQTLASFGI